MRRASKCILVTALLLGLSGCLPGAVWSPDGNQVAMDPDGKLVVYDRVAGRMKQISTGAYTVFNPVWSQDGRKILFYGALAQDEVITRLDLLTVDLETEQQEVVVEKVLPAEALAPDPDNPFRDDPGFKSMMTLAMKTITRAAWSRVGNRIAYLGGDPTPQVTLIDPDGQNATTLNTGRESHMAPVWSPDGEHLAFIGLPLLQPTDDLERLQVAAREIAARLYVVNADGSGLKTIWSGSRRGKLFPFAQPAWSSDGQSLGLLVAAKGQEISLAGMDFAPRAWVAPLNGGPARKQWRVTSPFAAFGPSLSNIFYIGGKFNAGGPPLLVHNTWPDNRSQVFGELKLPPPPEQPQKNKEEGLPLIQLFPQPAFSPDGKTVALLTDPLAGPAVLRLIDLETGRDVEMVAH